MKKLFIIFLVAAFSLPVTAQSYKGESKNKTASEKLNDQYCTGLFKTTDGTIMDIASSSASAYGNIIDWLESRVSGLQVYTSRTGLSIPLIRGSVPGIYVDENPVSVSYLNMMNINDIAIVKIIKTPFFGGFNSGSGAIAIYTFADEEEENGDSK
ncbi:MAG: hypothetical protein ABIR30_01340 [Chitinophagaceae bacterium]